VQHQQHDEADVPSDVFQETSCTNEKGQVGNQTDEAWLQR
jgi:hypothetical protein